MRVLVVGCGSIGQRHIRNLRDLGHDVVGWDTNPSVQKFVGIHSKEPNWSVDACLICTPPDSHLSYLQQAIDRGVPVFVEKPLSDSLVGVSEVLQESKDKGIPIQVGYNLRFHPSLVWVKEHLNDIGTTLAFYAHFGQYFPDWRPSQDYRISYSTTTGILLEASHEFDYSRWLLGEPEVLSSHSFNTHTVGFLAEDIADAQLMFPNGVIGNISLNCIEREYSRWCKVVGTVGTIWWDYRDFCASLQRSGLAPVGMVATKDANSMYVAEIKSFLQCVRTGEKPLVSGEDGLAVLRIVAECRTYANRHIRSRPGS